VSEPEAAGPTGAEAKAQERETAEPDETASEGFGMVREARVATIRGTNAARDAPSREEAGAVVLEYCAVVRGILNDDQGGPLQPPGLRMAAALREVRASLERNLAAKKGGCGKKASTARGPY
jgi:hypothetical protein